MTKIEDGAEPSGASVPQKDYVILGKNVYERVNKLPEDVMKALLCDDEKAPVAQKSNRSVVVTREWLGRLILEVQHKLWGQSSYADFYGILRDIMGYNKSKRCFEEIVNCLHKELHLDYNCPKNTLSSAFSRNKYLRYNCSKWRTMGAQKRSCILAQSIVDAISIIK